MENHETCSRQRLGGGQKLLLVFTGELQYLILEMNPGVWLSPEHYAQNPSSDSSTGGGEKRKRGRWMPSASNRNSNKFSRGCFNV